MNVTTPPWQEKDLGYGAKLGLTLLGALLLVVGIVALFIALAMGSSFVRGTTVPHAAFSDLVVVIIAAVVCIASIVGLILIWPYTRGPARFTPAYGPVAPTITEHPFDVRFQRFLWGRSMRGAGTVQFTPDGLAIAGHLEPHILFQIGVVFVVTVLPLVLFRFGLGIIPALIITYYLGRKRVALTLPYTTVRNITLQGRQLTLHTDQTPRCITFAVSSTDGERLYREVQARYPTLFSVPVP